MAINATNINGASPEIEVTRSPAPVSKSEETVSQTEQKTASVLQFKGDEAPKKDQVQEIVETLNEYTNVLQTKLGFSINENAEKIVVTVKNKETDEIIRQIPAEELMLIQEKMEELTGLLLNKKV